MRATTYAALAVTALVTLVLALMASSCPTKAARRERLMREVRADFVASRDVLEAFARRAAMEGPPLSGEIDFAAIRNTRLGRRIRHGTQDANGNLYFILRDSWVTFNVGLVRRKGRANLLGDQQEPRIDYTERIEGDWFFYHAS